MNRCRLILVIPASLADAASSTKDALAGGDVASIIIAVPGSADVGFQSRCKSLVAIAQEAGVAAIVANDSRIAGRTNADGYHLDLPGGNVGVPELGEAVASFAPDKIVGAGKVNSRHMALSLGEANPDYVFFGRLDGDIKPQAHPKLMTLANWWSEMVEIPGICLGGSAVDSVVEVAKTGVDFVALSSAVFGHENGAEAAVRQANTLLDAHAPELKNE